MLAINMRGFGEAMARQQSKECSDAQTMFRYLVNDKGIDPKILLFMVIP